MMLKQDAFNFGYVISELWLRENICDRSSELPLDSTQISDSKQPIHDLLQEMMQLCTVTNMVDRIGPEISRFQKALPNLSLKDIAKRCDILRERLLDELKKEFFFHVPEDAVPYFNLTTPFGDNVAKKFPTAKDDFQQAGKCLSLQQPTACVFHLMRGMEAAVRRLARKLNMTIKPQTTWRQLTGNMDTKIKSMPETTVREKNKKNNWESARVNLHHLGSVLRNNTMHPASVYTQDQAKHIFESVGVSMKSLCGL
ncbi:hypothetical protein ACMAUO_19080 [Gluconacetobacter sp. Hr-1-5]|uniref:hypothetical protein n=1 Tax=Gluconacetobacter sp. Hr-1-5 TaxID=3395370 RepID=UPI003B51AE72